MAVLCFFKEGDFGIFSDCLMSDSITVYRRGGRQCFFFRIWLCRLRTGLFSQKNIYSAISKILQHKKEKGTKIGGRIIISFFSIWLKKHWWSVEITFVHMHNDIRLNWIRIIFFTDVFLSYLFTKLIEEKYTWWTIPQHHNWFQLTFANFSLQTKSQNPVSNLVNTFAEQEQRVWQNLELQGTADRLWISANVEYRISVYRVLFQFTMCCHHIF